MSTSYFGDEGLAPDPNAEDAPFWAHCAQQRLCFQCCTDCGLLTHPPLGICPHCQSMRRDWVQAPAQARVFSFTWIHTTAHPSMKRELPYNVAVVEFDELPGVRLISNVVDAKPGGLQVGDGLKLVWEAAGSGMFVPRFCKTGT